MYGFCSKDVPNKNPFNFFFWKFEGFLVKFSIFSKIPRKIATVIYQNFFSTEFFGNFFIDLKFLEKDIQQASHGIAQQYYRHCYGNSNNILLYSLFRDSNWLSARITLKISEGVLHAMKIGKERVFFLLQSFAIKQILVDEFGADSSKNYNHSSST